MPGPVSDGTRQHRRRQVPVEAGGELRDQRLQALVRREVCDGPAARGAERKLR